MAKTPFRIDVGLTAGNSTANLVADSSQLILANTQATLSLYPNRVQVGTEVIVNTSAITIGSTIINTSSFSISLLNVGANVSVNTSAVKVGNTTVTSTDINTTDINANTLSLHTIGANQIGSYQTFANNQLLVGNNTVRTVINATHVVANNYVGNGQALTNARWNGANYTISTGNPSGMSDGDFWFKRDA